MVPHALADADGDDIVEADGATDPPLEPVTDEVSEPESVVEIVGDNVNVTDPDEVSELDSVVEIVGDKVGVPDPDCDMETVPQGDAVVETDRVAHALADADGDDIVEADGATEPPLVPLPVEVSELDCVVEIVVETVGVTDPDCDPETVPQSDAE